MRWNDILDFREFERIVRFGDVTISNFFETGKDLGFQRSRWFHDVCVPLIPGRDDRDEIPNPSTKIIRAAETDPWRLS